MSIASWLSNRKKKAVPDVAIGQKFALAGMQDPWGIKNGFKPVLVLDVKDGWVRYYVNDLFHDERLRTAAFLYCYEPLRELK